MYSGVAWNSSRHSETGVLAATGLKVTEVEVVFVMTVFERVELP
jgi:hypothetical protein